MKAEDLKILFKECNVSKDKLLDGSMCVFLNGKSYTIKPKRKHVVVKEITGKKIFHKRYCFTIDELF